MRPIAMMMGMMSVANAANVPSIYSESDVLA